MIPKEMTANIDWWITTGGRVTREKQSPKSHQNKGKMRIVLLFFTLTSETEKEMLDW
jgi:hypothetical protein